MTTLGNNMPQKAVTPKAATSPPPAPLGSYPDTVNADYSSGGGKVVPLGIVERPSPPEGPIGITANPISTGGGKAYPLGIVANPSGGGGAEPLGIVAHPYPPEHPEPIGITVNPPTTGGGGEAHPLGILA